MTPRRRRFVFDLFPLFRVCVACLALGVGGCGDDEDDPLEPQPSPSPSPSPNPGPNLGYPEAVLTTLEMAYSTRDSAMYKQIFDSTYTGRSVDLYDASTIDVTYWEEGRHIAALARTTGLTASLDLGGFQTWDRLNSDDPSHPEWAIIQILGSNYRIEITEPGGQVLGAIGEAGTFQEFAFRPYPDDSSPTDTLWKIVRWRETGKSAFP